MTPDAAQPALYRVDLSFLIHVRDQAALLSACSEAESEAMLGVVSPEDLLSGATDADDIPIPYGIWHLMQRLLDGGLPGAKSHVERMSFDGPIEPSDPDGRRLRDGLGWNPPDDDGGAGNREPRHPLPGPGAAGAEAEPDRP